MFFFCKVGWRFYVFLRVLVEVLLGFFCALGCFMFFFCKVGWRFYVFLRVLVKVLLGFFLCFGMFYVFLLQRVLGGFMCFLGFW